MVRTNAPGLYGFRSALYGTLLPSPMIALSFPDLVERILKEGHEAAFHAWDHRRWQDELSVRSMDWIRNWFDRGVTAFEKLTGRRPASFGAPAWLIDDRALEVAAGHRFDYLSCTRAREPFVHAGWGLVEIPSNLPCFEETGPEPGVPKILALLKEGGLHVLPVHAEAEGGIWSRYFIDLLEKTASTDCTILPLGEIRKRLSVETLPVRKHRMALLPGRSAPCAV
jgi:peptidoglycan/xylan/chitin deacetylase (PgdA/CDA1 family)